MCHMNSSGEGNTEDEETLDFDRTEITWEFILEFILSTGQRDTL